MLNKKNLEPFEGIVFQDRCKAVVFNHGLYTQCKNVCSGEFCSSLCKKIKYGHINTRKNYPVGMYVLPNGKREIKLSTLIKRLSKKDISIQHSQRINTDDSDDEARQTISDLKIVFLFGTHNNRETCDVFLILLHPCTVSSVAAPAVFKNVSMSPF